MNMRRIGIAGVLAALAFNAWSAPGSTAPASAGKTKLDVNGTWNATIEGGRGPAMSMVYVFKQEKDKLTGTVSTNGGPPVEIKNGKVYKTKVTFAVEMTMPAMQMPGAPPSQKPAEPMKITTKYEGNVEGDTMIIETQMGGGMGGGMPMGGGGGMPMGGGGGGMPMGGGGDMGGGGGMAGPPPGGGGGGMAGPPPGGGGMGGGRRMGGMGKITATRAK